MMAIEWRRPALRNPSPFYSLFFTLNPEIFNKAPKPELRCWRLTQALSPLASKMIPVDSGSVSLSDKLGGGTAVWELVSTFRKAAPGAILARSSAVRLPAPQRGEGMGRGEPTLLERPAQSPTPRDFPSFATETSQNEPLGVHPLRRAESTRPRTNPLNMNPGLAPRGGQDSIKWMRHCGCDHEGLPVDRIN